MAGARKLAGSTLPNAKMPRAQFKLRTLFLATSGVALACAVGRLVVPIWQSFDPLARSFVVMVSLPLGLSLATLAVLPFAYRRAVGRIKQSPNGTVDDP
jgi:hypothetical protein